MITLRITSDPLNELLAKARAVGQEGDMALAGAVGAANLVRNHLFDLDNKRANQMGGKRSHFYTQAAESVQEAQVSGASASFQITKIGLAQRWLGGEIKAGEGTSSVSGGPTKYLAIPARAEAYGTTPKSWAGELEFVPLGRNRGMLVEIFKTSLLGKNGKRLKNPAARADQNTTGSLVIFWLVPSVNQKADPTVMPTQEAMTAAAGKSMAAKLARIMEAN